ncbi:MAG: Xaa-Pro peptidase family protein [Beijerinckiaceae bacterium]|nr:Xaa-Pro peptidase family protein [Beijerinckiaceae bacterium]
MKKDRITTAIEWLKDEKLDGLIAFNDGQNSFLDSNAVYVFSGVRPIGRSAVIIGRDGSSTLIVEPVWDEERARGISFTTRTRATENLVQALSEELTHHGLAGASLAVVALAKQSRALDRSVRSLLASEPRAADTLASHLARIRNAEELAAVKKAVWIAERGYERLVASARPGIREFELAADIYVFMKELGAEDNFLLMSASQHNLAVRAAGRRILQEGDIILGEITPCFQGQFVQICRTTVLGDAKPVFADKYALVQRAMRRGMDAAVPGATMGEVTQAMNDVFREGGYADYCRPPYMRVRGHGLGVTSDRPGDVVEDSDVKLEEGMVFVMHPNQYIPETGYLMCGETVIISHNGAISLSEADAELDFVSV